MLKKKAQVIITFLFLADIFIVGFCWNIAYYVRFYWLNIPIPLLGIEIPYVNPEEIPRYKEYFNATGVVVIAAAICFVYGKMYNPKRISQYKGELRAVLKSNIFLFIVLLGLTFYYRRFSYSRIQSLYFFLLTVGCIGSLRISVRLFLSYLRRTGKNLRRILIIGSGKTAVTFIKKVHDNKRLGFDVIGFSYVDDGNCQVSLPFLGNFEELPHILEKKAIDQVFICLDSNQQSHLEEINHQLAEQVVDIHIVPDIYHTLNINPEVLDLDGMPVIALRQSTIEGWNMIFKRAFDLVGATIAIIVLLPVWIILPILIKLTSPGPVFYLQERMGLDGKSFNMIKFRSMRIDAEEETGAVWARKDDDRKTLIGAFIRKTSLDEIPQFLNVMRGSMSLVGPRPERPVFIKEFKKQIPNYMLRHKMKAGITGWAQVNGWRGNTSLEKRIEYDIYYLTHWSILFDIKICFMTLFTGMINQNAY
ncbi:undecaprenyl-phosphate glucose phosphotransferase [bacterium]|nr:undecaprenyl-phosphate glucose phosphotransferase [bacterium]